MELALSVTFRVGREASCYMGNKESIVDRIARERKVQKDADELNARLALERNEAVTENSEPLWTALGEELERLAGEANQKLRAGFTFHRQTEALGGTRYLVKRDTYPVLELQVWRPSSVHFFQFTRECEPGSFREPQSFGNGRIEIKADSQRNVYMVAGNETLTTPEKAAAWLLEPLLRSL